MTNNVRDIQKNASTKFILAKLLAEENISIEIRKTKTAQFDIQNRILIIPQLQEDLDDSVFDLLLSHEVAHALETPIAFGNTEPFGNETATQRKTILNIVEDARIEKFIQKKYPGLQKTYYTGYKILLDKDFFGIKNNPNLNNVGFLDRLNLEMKCGVHLNVPFTSSEQILVGEVRNLRQWSEVVAVSRKIYQHLIHYPNSDPTIAGLGGDVIIDPTKTLTKTLDPSENLMEKLLKGRVGDPKIEKIQEFEDDPITIYKKFSVNRPVVSPKEGQPAGDVMTPQGEHISDGTEDNQEETDNPPTEIPNSQTPQPSPRYFENPVEGDIEHPDIDAPIFDQAESNKENLYDMGGSQIINVNIPPLKMEEIIIPEQFVSEVFFDPNTLGDRLTKSKTLYKNYVDNNKAAVNYLATLFELRKNARQMEKISYNRTGNLDPKKLSQYKFSTDLFKKNMIIPKGKSHGLVLFMDWSSSMEANLYHSLCQLFCLTDFCRRTNIPFETYAFASGSGIKMSSKYNQYKQRLGKEEDIKANNLPFSERILYPHLSSHGTPNFSNYFALIPLLNHRMTQQNYTNTQKILFGRTPKGMHHHGGSFHDNTTTLLQMGSTPLNETIISAMSIVPRFQKQYKLDIVNTVFVTDGASDTTLTYINDAFHNTLKHITTHSYYSASYNSVQKDKLYFRDMVTKVEVESNLEPQTLTYYLLKLLELATKSNVIGFFLCNNNLGNILTPEERVLFYKKGIGISFNSGYTEYYVINTPLLSTFREVIGEADAPLKNLASLKEKRVILERFINLISKRQ